MSLNHPDTTPRIIGLYFDFPLLRRYPAPILRVAWVELLICMVIIAILAATGTKIFQGYINTAKVIHAVSGAMALGQKNYILTYHAVTGQFPCDDEQTIHTGFDIHKILDDDLKDYSILIEDGAMHVQMKKYFQGHTISLRPAVSKVNPTGPVVWFAGKPLRPEYWTLAGQDRTTVPLSYINPRLR